MSDEGIMAGKLFSLESFTQHDFYQNILCKLVDLADLKPGQRVLDLGAGTGAVTRLLADKVKGLSSSEVIAVEPSGPVLAVARRNTADIKDVIIRLIQAGAEQFSSFIERPLDAVFFCNAIHLVRDKARVVEEVFRSLRRGGLFCFNTTFFQGGEPPESRQFYRRWMIRSLRLLKSRYQLSPASDKAAARNRLSPEEYQQLVKEQGFLIKLKETVQVDMSLQSWLDISNYELWIQGILPGIPLNIGAEVLQETVRETFAELELESSPRLWLQVVAQRT
jgi:ubiquinone/menaquinone biosynthesis C-methylase UbiE